MRHSLGKVVATAAVAAAVPHDVIVGLLDRHAGRDWGDLDAEDKAANDSNHTRLWRRNSALGGTLRADAHAAMDYRYHRLAVLRRQLAQLTAQICATPVGSPERDALLIPMEPLMDTVLALADELHC